MVRRSLRGKGTEGSTENPCLTLKLQSYHHCTQHMAWNLPWDAAQRNTKGELKRSTQGDLYKDVCEMLHIYGS